MNDAMGPMPRAQHYAFAHRELPSLFDSDPERCFRVLRHGGDDFLLYLWNRVGANMEEADTAPPEGLSHEIRRLDEGQEVALITLPAPLFVPEAYFIALVQLSPNAQSTCTNGPRYRYITLERGVRIADGATRTVLCEWASGTHRNLGDGPAADVDAFFTSVCWLLVE